MSNILNTNLKKLLLQPNNSLEVRTCSHFAMLHDVEVEYCKTLEGRELNPGEMPVGSVEFIKPVLPKDYVWACYPKSLEEFLYREIDITLKEWIDTSYPQFVKPVDTKLFTGFVLGQDDEEQKVFDSLPNDTDIYVSDVVKFITEYRVYITNKKILAIENYLGDEKKMFDISVLSSMISKSPIVHSYVIDIGVLDTGETAIVEVNDAWAIGLYGYTLKSDSYVSFLWNRWENLWQN